MAMGKEEESILEREEISVTEVSTLNSVTPIVKEYDFSIVSYIVTSNGLDYAFGNIVRTTKALQITTSRMMR